jgi:hypothetical protein
MAKNKENTVPTQSEEEQLQKRLDDLMSKMEELLLNNADIELAAIVLKTKQDEEPRVWRKGHFYDVATMLNQVMHAYRSKAAVDLGN